MRFFTVIMEFQALFLFYTNIKVLFVWLDALISETTDPIWKILSVLDSSFIEEGYRLYIITLRPIGAEHS